MSKKLNSLVKNKINEPNTTKKGGIPPNRGLSQKGIVEMKINEKNHTAMSKAISGSNHSINETNSLGDTKIVEFDQPDNANHADKANR